MRLLNHKHIFLVLFLLVVATLLRFYHFTELPLTDDEFSALSRLNAPSFTTLIQEGVVPDGHPAGQHVFLYYYTQWFGTSALVYKLPNLILGVLSVLLLYGIGRLWFNASAGLFAAALLSSLQYSIVQSQINRMYGFGLFFVLLAIYCMSRFQKRKEPAYGALFFYVVAASIACYSHYFSLLTMAIYGFTSFLLAKGAKKAWIGLAGLIVVGIFIPHLKITLSQWQIGGIQDWLGPFHWHFFRLYFPYLFHYSWFVLAGILFFIVVNWKASAVYVERRYRLLSFLWFVMPILIGVFYSLSRSNLLHERVLYFSFPFLLLFLASFVRQVSFKREVYMLLILLTLNAGTLIYLRKHYSLFYTNRYELVASKALEWEQKYQGSIKHVVFSRPFIEDWYQREKGQVTGTVVHPAELTFKAYVDSLRSDTSDYLYFGSTESISPNYFAVAYSFFPYIVEHAQTVVGQAYLLAKQAPAKVEPCSFFEQEMFRDDQLSKQGVDSLVRDSLEGMWFASAQEYIGTQSFALDRITFSSNNVVFLSVKAVQLDSLANCLLVAQIEKDGEVLDWRSQAFSDFISYGDTATLTQAILLPDIHYPKGSTLKCFIWNKQKTLWLLQDYSLRVDAGNPFVYANFRKVPFHLSPYCMKHGL